MARVSIDVNVNDLSRRGIQGVRRSLDRLQRRMQGMNTRVRLTVPTNDASRSIRRVRRLLRDVPRNTRATITVRTTGGRLAARRIAALRRSLPNRHRIRVVVDPPGPGFMRRMGRRIGVTLGRSALAPLRILGRTVSGILSDGVGQGIIGAFQAAGPVAILVLANIIAGAVAVIGAALAGVLVLAFGGALVAVGAVFAAQSKVIKRNWKSAVKSMKEDLKGAADPLIPVVHKAIHVLEGLVESLAPKMKEFFTTAAPQLEGFLASMEDGFRKFGHNSWDSMTNAFNVFLNAFGPQWEGFMSDLGDSFGALGRTVSSHSTEIAMALRAVLQLVVYLVNIVNFLANAWALAIRAITYQVGTFLKSMSVMVSGALTAVDAILGAIEPLAKVMGLGGAVKTARNNIKAWRDSTASTLDDMGQRAMDYGKTLDKANKKRQLEVDIAGFKAKLKAARADLSKTANKKAKAKLKADISDLNAKIAAARAKLNSLNGKTANTYVKTWYTSSGGATGQGGTRGGRLATGGIVGMVRGAATGGARGNMTLVGEQGPELVNLPAGSHVRSNPDTRRIMAQQGSAATASLVFKSSGRRVDDLLLEILREAIHQRGGNPVAVLGG